MSGANAWIDVAKKDFADAARSKMLWALSALMILFVGILTYIPQALNDDPAIENVLLLMSTPILLLVPILGLIVGYMSIIGERDTGSIRALLALPIVRWEVLVGKFLGRVSVLSLPVVAGFVIGSGLATVLYDGAPGQAFLGMALVALLMGVVYVSVAVAVSASVNSRGKAMALVVAALLVLEYAWQYIGFGIYYLLNGEMPSLLSPPDWLVFFNKLTPANAVGSALSTIIEFPQALTFDGTFPQEAVPSGDVPLYLQDWVSWIVVALWIAVPLAIGYYRFQRATIS